MNAHNKICLIAKQLASRGFKSWVVGGAVRDICLGLKPKDWDICTDALPEDILSCFEHTIPVGIEFGTVIVVVDDEQFEITTLRGDGNYSDGRRPDEVKFVTSLKEDLARRDFTINAMARDIFTGEIIDFFGGQEDLNQKIVRCVGEPDIRFKEDGLRIFRAIRFCACLGFDMDCSTFESVIKNVNMLNNVSAERIRDELEKTLLSNHPQTGMRLLRDVGAFQFVCPEMINCIDCGQNEFHEFDVFGHISAVVSHIKKDRVLRLAAFFHDIGKPSTKARNKRGSWSFIGHEIASAEIAEVAMRRLKFDTHTIRRVCHLVRGHMRGMSNVKRPKSIRHIIFKIGKENLNDWLELRRADVMGKAKGPLSENEMAILNAFRSRLLSELDNTIDSRKELCIDGNDVKLLLPHKEDRALIGAVIRRAIKHVLAVPRDNNREQLSKMLTGFISDVKRANEFKK